MTELTQKNQKFDWGEEQEEAFQLLKQKLCAAPILALPEGSDDFVVYCDASIKGLGAVLIIRSSSVRPEDMETIFVWRHYLNMRQRRWIELLSDWSKSRFNPSCYLLDSS
ncbi:putative reverse transcriptase domain-containing protein [Tanacetum coccineum]